MKTLSRRGGFSLVELLTVIAIIAILAAIIFPVMGMVKDRARQNQCMTNLHQIAMGVQMFKTDNRKYPDVLGAKVKYDGSTPVAFEAAKGDGQLFGEYVKTPKMLHCPSANIATSPTVQWDNLSGGQTEVYTYDSYDCWVDAAGANPETHYALQWVPGATADAGIAWLQDTGSGMPPDPSMTNNEATTQQDYERQLRFRNPPGDSVVTWCSYHEVRANSSVSGKALVVYLDGSAEAVEAKHMEVSRWRMRPRKG